MNRNNRPGTKAIGAKRIDAPLKLVETKSQLEALVVKLDRFVGKSRLAEAGEQAPAQATPPTPAPATASKNPPNTDKHGHKVTDVVDQLNSIRGGKSFKDTEVQTQLDRYFQSLDDAAKDALIAYLKGIAQIVSGQVPAGQAQAPKQAGVEIVATGKRVRSIKPNVIRKSSPASQPAAAPAVASKPPKEDTTAPAPIVPKQR